MNQKIVISTLILILLAAGGVAYYIITQKEQGIQESIQKKPTNDGSDEAAPVDKAAKDNDTSGIGNIEAEEASQTTADKQTVPPGYDANRIDVKYRIDTDVSNPISLIPKELRGDVDSVTRLAPAGGSEFRWLRFVLKTAADESIFIVQLQSLDWVEIAEFAPLPAPPPNNF